jgi:aminoglycoside 3-N-acetyltransferase
MQEIASTQERILQPSDFTHDLNALGVRGGDTLMVHASLRAIGPVEGGADGVLEALDRAVGPGGTLLMILGAEIARDFVNHLPEAERPALLANAPPFDPATAPVLPEVGYLAEAFRKRDGTLVTNNPSGRFAACGRRAQELLQDAPWQDYYGPGSPLDRFCQARGRVLRLGASPDTTTVLHFSEYLADVPTKRRVRRHYVCHGADNAEIRAIECLDDEHGIVDWPGEDYFATILREYLATGRVRQGRVGQANSELIEAGDLVRFGADWMTRHFARMAGDG